jgi:hypothetical protein
MRLNTVTLAMIAHEANRVYCESIEDYSQRHWEDSPAWQQNSAIDGVRNIIAEVVTKPSDSHESWMRDKEKDGWVYGEVKDADKKTHPCFVPYNELPEDQKMKDYIFFNIVSTLMKL